MDMTDFAEEQEAMVDAIEAGDADEIGRIFKDARRQRDEAEASGDVKRRMWLERLLGGWLIDLTEAGLLVETH